MSPDNSRPTPEWALTLPRLFHAESATRKSASLSDRTRVAVHSGKLGDIVYALPTCRALGIEHLVLNAYVPASEPLRQFPIASAQSLVSLLLEQPYLREVSITETPFALENIGIIPGIDFNFDTYRQVARHRIGRVIHDIHPRFANFRNDDAPAHLGEHFAAALGVEVDLASPWLTSPAAQISRGAVVVSVTQNWRSYPDDYWHRLLEGMRDVIFVGHESEWQRAGLPQATFVATHDHRELASVIAGARLFLGTVSFPYALAEGLKVPRGVEVCHRNLNAFPVGKNAMVLPPDVRHARARVADFLELGSNDAYRQMTRRMQFDFSVIRRKALVVSILTQPANQTRSRAARRWLASKSHPFRYFLRQCLRTLKFRTS